jgi:chemotaxis protein methyltransferase CheR
MAGFLTDAEFELFSRLIYEGSGIHFSASNRPILESRLRERLKSSKLAAIKEYHALILSDQEEMKILLDSVTTNLTWFFRYTAHFLTLENMVLPDLVAFKKKKGQNRIRLWSAGCSTGEEPYSLAMLLKDKLPPEIGVEIIASDLSLKSLMTAKAGFYPEGRISGIPEKYLHRFLEAKNDGWQVKDEIKKLIRFDYHNLRHESGFRDVDAVFCRNVLIYFDAQAQAEVVNRFWDILTPHSFLFIGHSESLFGMETKFEFLKTDWACIYRKMREP